MRFPDMHLLGESHSWAGQKVQVLLQSMTEKEVPIMRMKLVEAELVKIAINNFVTMKISFANALLQCASKIGNINIDVVTDAMGLDSRIGSSYLRGSVPYGGPCFPRDTRALAALMGNLGVENSLAIATERLNASHLEFILQQIVSSLTPKSTIGVVGLSYKLGSPVTEESPGISLIQKLLSLGYRVYGYDDEQAVTPTLESDWNFHECRKIEELMSLVDFVVITREIKDVDLFREYLKKYSKNYLDLWRYL
jgi:UDPglucose 6-dehydrogenase